MMSTRLPALVALALVTAGSADAQQPRDFTPFVMADRAAEIALARTAAPSTISDSATVLVFTPTGFVEAARGTNGFTCVVLRSFSASLDDPNYWNPHIRAPHCFNPPASRTVMPEILQQAAWILAGVSPTETMARSKQRYASHLVPPPAPGAMTYMLSKEQYLQEENPHAVPHLMFYYDKSMPAATLGATEKSTTVIDGLASDPNTTVLTLFIPVRRWSDGTNALPGAAH